MSKASIAVIVVVLIIGGLGYISMRSTEENFSAPLSGESATLDPRNATYLIDNEAVTLADGLAETAGTPDSAAKKITRYFGNEVKADFNGDDLEDEAFLITQESGGSGTFFYIAALLGDGGKGKVTDAVFLGDRIAPQSTNFEDGLIFVNYAERRPDEPFTAEPSVGVSRYFKITGEELAAAEPPARLPLGYTLDSYRVEEVSATTCALNSDCQTPGEYSMQSRCPFVSLCLDSKCTVVCPDHKGE